MKVLIIGGTGFISQRLVQLLLDANHQLTLLNRGHSPNPFEGHANLEFLYGDRNDPRTLQDAVAQGSYDVVYDFVGYEPEQAEAVVRILPGKVGRYVFCSTISVYMVSDRVRCPITENQDSAPLMSYWERNPFGMDYGLKKRKFEEILWRAHNGQRFRVSMLRPTYVCGPSDPTRRDYFWIQRILDRRLLLVPGSGDHAFQQVYVEDVARAFYSLLDKEASTGQAYNVASEEIFSLNEYLKALGELLSEEPEIVHIAEAEFDQLDISWHPDGDVFPFNTHRTAIFSLDKIKRDLDYPSTPFAEWMPKTINWFVNSYGGDSVGYERRNEELQIIERLNLKR